MNSWKTDIEEIERSFLFVKQLKNNFFIFLDKNLSFFQNNIFLSEKFCEDLLLFDFSPDKNVKVNFRHRRSKKYVGHYYRSTGELFVYSSDFCKSRKKLCDAMLFGINFEKIKKLTDDLKKSFFNPEIIGIIFHEHVHHTESIKNKSGTRFMDRYSDKDEVAYWNDPDEIRAMFLTQTFEKCNVPVLWNRENYFNSFLSDPAINWNKMSFFTKKKLWKRIYKFWDGIFNGPGKTLYPNYSAFLLKT